MTNILWIGLHVLLQWNGSRLCSAPIELIASKEVVRENCQYARSQLCKFGEAFKTTANEE